MYSDDEIDNAVKSGALTAEAAAAFRAHVARSRAAPPADEEHFRLLTSFADIFVAGAAALVLVSIGWIGTSLNEALGGAAVAMISWVLAEFFTRRRRMALPSILLLLTFVGGTSWAAWNSLADYAGLQLSAELAATVSLIAALSAWIHWRRFHVPIAIATCAAGLVALAFSLVGPWVLDGPSSDAMTAVKIISFISGIAVFAVAMRWDLCDPARATGRSDVAFWLHLLAAPLVIHPVFSLTDDGADPIGSAALIVVLYALVAIAALVIDRRALLVAALIYLLAAVHDAVRDLAALELRVAVTTLIVGAALLLLSAFWRRSRAAILRGLPRSLRTKLPAAPETSIP